MKVIKCRDVGFDCDAVVRAPTEEQALQMAAQHAKEAHGIDTVPPDVVEKVRGVMKDE